MKPYWLYVGNFNEVGNHTARAAAAAWAYGYALGSRPVNKVVYNKKIVYKASAYNNRKFVVELVAQHFCPVGAFALFGDVFFGVVVVYIIALNHALFRQIEKQKAVFHKLFAPFGRKRKIVGLFVLP